MRRAILGVLALAFVVAIMYSVPAFASTTDSLTTQLSCDPNCTAVPLGTTVNDTITISYSGFPCTPPEGVTSCYASAIFVYPSLDCTGTSLYAIDPPVTSNGQLHFGYTPLSAGPYSYSVDLHQYISPYAEVLGPVCEPFTVVAPNSVPQFPLGLGLIVVLAVPALILLRRRLLLP